MKNRIRKTGGRILCRLSVFLFPAVAAAAVLLTEPPGYALFFFAAVALHECGHLSAFLLLGRPLPAFSGRAGGLLLAPDRRPLSYEAEIFLCLAGPLFNFALCAALLPAVTAEGGNGANFCFFALNLLTGAFNLLPIDGFDGGRAGRAFLSLCLPDRAAEWLSSTVSLLSLLLLFYVGQYLFFHPAGGSGLWLLSAFLLFSSLFDRNGGKRRY